MISQTSRAVSVVSSCGESSGAGRLGIAARLSSEGSGLSCAAVRAADARAAVLVAIRPRISTAVPQAVRVHHAGWVAAAKAAPAAALAGVAAIAPTIATPSVCPNCREVVATAAATPACVRGMPEIAAFVIGALTNPKPDRTRCRRRAGAGWACSGSVRSGSRRRRRVPMPEMMSGIRGPWWPTIQPEIGEVIIVIAAIGRVESAGGDRGERGRLAGRGC